MGILGSTSFGGHQFPEETSSLLPKKVSTYRQCCCCSVGTGVTLWAVFLVGVSLYFLFDLNIKGAIFTTGAVLSLLTATLLLTAAGQQNAFLAYIAFYMQILVYLAWTAQAAVTCVALWQMRNVAGGDLPFPDTAWSLFHPLRAVLSEYPVSQRHEQGPTKSVLTTFRQVDVPLYLYEALLVAFYVLQLALAYFVLRMLWSFYRILQAGGTGFEGKPAEELEEAALRYQLPSYTADETPREDPQP